MVTADELRKFADDCHRMALSTNDPRWNEMAGRLLRCEASSPRETAIQAAGHTKDRTRGVRRSGQVLASIESAAENFTFLMRP